MDDRRIRDIDTFLLRVLLALIHHQSVTRAALDLGVSQATLSQSLAKLRTIFNDQLFVRTQRGVCPNEAALAIAESAREIGTLLDDMLMRTSQFDPARERRTITICISDVGEVLLIPSLVEKLREVAPFCHVQTIYPVGEELGDMMQQGKIDLLVTGPIKSIDGLMQWKLYTEQMVVVCAPGSKFTGSTISAETFRTATHIVNSATTYDQELINTQVSSCPGRSEIYLSTYHYVPIPTLLQHRDDLVAIVPAALANYWQDRGMVRILAPDFPIPTAEIRQYWHRRFDRDKFLIWLRTLIKELYSSTSTSQNFPSKLNLELDRAAATVRR